MAQLHYSDQEARRQLADVDHVEPVDQLQLQGEGYGVPSDDQQLSSNSSPQRSEAPLEVHHKRDQYPISADQNSPSDAPAGFGNLDHKRNDPIPTDSSSALDVSASYGNLDAKTEDAGNAPFDVSAGYGNLDAKPEDAGNAPFDVSHRNLDAKPEDAGNASPASGYGGQLDQLTKLIKDEGYADTTFPASGHGGQPDQLFKPKDEGFQGNASPASGYGGGQLDQLPKPKVEGYTSLGIDESSSEHSLGIPSEEGNTMKEKEGSSQESMAKELEDHPAAARGNVIDVQSLKKDYVDFSEVNSDQLKVDDPVLEPKHEDTAQFSSQIKSPYGDPKEDSPSDAPKQEQTEACPDANDTHGSETFQGDDGKEKINAEGYNIYSGEPENTVYNVTDVLGDQHENEKPSNDSVTDDDRSLYEPATDDDRLHDQAKLEDEHVGAGRDEKITPREFLSGDSVQDEIAQEQRSDVQERGNDKAILAEEKDDDHIAHDNVCNEEQPRGEAIKPFEDLGAQDDKATLAEEKDDDLIVRGNVCNEEQPRGGEAIKPFEDLGAQEDKPTLADEKDDDQIGEATKPFENIGAQEDKVTLAEEKDDDQIARGDVRNEEQPRGEAIKPFEDLSAQEQSSSTVVPEERKKVNDVDHIREDQLDEFGEPKEDRHVSAQGEPDVPVQADLKEDEQEDFGGTKEERDISKDVRDDEVSRDWSGPGTTDISGEQFTDHISSPRVQDAGLKVDPNNRKVDNELANKEGSDQVSERENVDASKNSPYSEFGSTENYAKAGYGGEGFVPKDNEDVERELREPTVKVEQEVERRPTDEHPLDKSPELDMSKEEDSKGSDAYGIKEGNADDVRGLEYGKADGRVNDEQIDDADALPQSDGGDGLVRPPASMPHPRAQDLTENFNSNNKENNIKGNNEAQHHHDEHPHKKGMFERIKEKLTSSD